MTLGDEIGQIERERQEEERTEKSNMQYELTHVRKLTLEDENEETEQEREGEREIKHAIGINTQVWKLTRKIMQERRQKKKGGIERKTEKEGEPALGHRRNRRATRAPSNCGLIFQPSVSMTTPSTTLPIFARNFGMKSDRDLIF